MRFINKVKNYLHLFPKPPILYFRPMIYSPHLTQNALAETYQHLLVSFDNHVLTLTLNRPEKKNAMNPVLMRELAFALSYARNEKEVWAVVIKANGDTFCAGADLKSFAGNTEESVSSIPEPEGEMLVGELFNLIHKPCIAQVQGNVLAGAFLIICGCQFVVSVPSATYNLPEVKRGLFPFQVLASLLKLMPERQAVNLCISGVTLSASEAKDAGIVTHIADADKLEETVQKIVSGIVKLSPTAIRKGLEAADELRAIGLPQQHSFLKNKLNDIVTTKDAAEGIMAFIEKREPNWTGE